MRGCSPKRIDFHVNVKFPGFTIFPMDWTLWVGIKLFFFLDPQQRPNLSGSTK